MGLIDQLWYLLRVLISLAVGFAIGFERKLRYKEAGIKTHALVCVGACLIMIISKYGLADIGSTDGARIAAQIVSGIGFLGAGIIMYRRDSLRGVTTAAGIWATAGVGMGIGAGQYLLSIGTAVLIIFLQVITHLPLGIFKTKRYYIYRIKFISTEGENENEKIKQIFKVSGFSRVNYYTTEKGVSVAAEISTNNTISDDEIKAIVFENAFISSIERIYQLDGKE